MWMLYWIYDNQHIIWHSSNDQITSVSLLCQTLCDPMDYIQHTRLPCPSLTPRTCSNSCPSNQWSHPTISSSASPSPPAFNLSQHQGLFQWVSSLHQAAKVLEFQLRHQSFQWIAFIITEQIECQCYLFTHHPLPFSRVLTLDSMMPCSIQFLPPCHKQTNNLPFVPIQDICIQ